MLGFLLQELYLCQYRYSLFIANTTEALLPALLSLVVVYKDLYLRYSGWLVSRLSARGEYRCEGESPFGGGWFVYE